jgi:hypothetical protein
VERREQVMLAVCLPRGGAAPHALRSFPPLRRGSTPCVALAELSRWSVCFLGPGYANPGICTGLQTHRSSPDISACVHWARQIEEKVAKEGWSVTTSEARTVVTLPEKCALS